MIHLLAPLTYICFLMWPLQHRNGNSNPVHFDWYIYHCLNYFWCTSHEFAISSACANIWRGKHHQWINIQMFWSSLRLRCQRILCRTFSAFTVFSWLVMALKTSSGTQFHGCTFHQHFAETNLTLIGHSPELFFCNLPEIGERRGKEREPGNKVGWKFVMIKVAMTLELS